jgi:hypothetical protein
VNDAATFEVDWLVDTARVQDGDHYTIRATTQSGTQHVLFDEDVRLTIPNDRGQMTPPASFGLRDGGDSSRMRS